MEFRQLEVFICVAKNLSFSKAAEELYISQPSVSAQIIALEKALGVQLLIRNNKSVSLTKAGLDFLLRAQKILTLRDQTIHSASGGGKTQTGILDIISSTIPAQHLLPEIIASFREQWPNIVFRVEQADSYRVEQEMRSFHYDFGMTGAAPDNGRFVYFPIYEDEFVLVMPNDMKYGSNDARQGSQEPGGSAGALRSGALSSGSTGHETDERFAEFVRSSPFIMRETGSGTRREIENLLTKIGVDLHSMNIPAYYSDAHSILLAVSRGMGISLISKVAALMYVKAGMLQAAEMGSALFRRKIYMLYNREIWLSPVQQAFADHARQYYLAGLPDSSIAGRYNSDAAI